MAGAPQQQQNTDNSLAMLWGLLLAFCLMGLIWFFFHDWIAVWILRIRIVEARLIASVFPRHRAWVKALEALSPHHVGFSDLASISTLVGRYLRFPISVMLLVFAWLTYRSRATLQFKRYYSMNTLVESEQKNWAQISPILELDLVNTPIDEGPWAMALTPFQFAKKNNLLQLEKVEPFVSDTAASVSYPHFQAKLKREAARHVLTMQLGPSWQDIDALPELIKALFAIFAARALHDKEAANQLLSELSRSFQEKSADKIMNLSKLNAEVLLKKHQNHPLVRAVIERHAYVFGVMASMLVLARQGGVLASADFLWLKPYDRALWFMLNCVGRKTSYIEVAGPFSHWVAECAVGHKLRAPMIDTSVDALEVALKEVHLVDEKQEIR